MSLEITLWESNFSQVQFDTFITFYATYVASFNTLTREY